MAAKRTSVEDERPTKKAVEQAERQLVGQQRVLEYDTKEFTIELLVSKLGQDAESDSVGDPDGNDFFIPSYQREFTWGHPRQSRFIESVLMGLPIPFLFFADMPDGRLEVVDGSQRLRTCRAFLGGNLTLAGCERLNLLDGFQFSDLPTAQQRRFRNRTIRAVVLSANATDDDRRDLFDRINTGSLIAEPAEVRRGSSPGKVTDLIVSLALDETLTSLCPMSEASVRLRTREELVARFFAFDESFAEELPAYRDRVTDFIDAWLKGVNKSAASSPGVVKALRTKFDTTMAFVSEHFPHGFSKTPGSKFTPAVRFDSIAVGAAQALRLKPNLRPRPVKQWLYSDEFVNLTTSNAANVRSKVIGRIEFVRDRLLGKA